MDEPRWKSNPILATKLAAYDGQRPYTAWQDSIAAARHEKFSELFSHYGRSPDNLEDALSLIAELALEHVDGFQIAVPPSRKAERKAVVEDAILLGAIKVAKEENPKLSVTGIIRDLAKWNNWPSDKASLENKRRRFYALDKNGSPERRNLGMLLNEIAQDFESHLAKLEKIPKN